MLDKGTPLKFEYLFYAHNNPGALRPLLERGAEPGVEDDKGATALLRACGLEEFDEYGFWRDSHDRPFGNVDSVVALLEGGARPDAPGSTNFRPIQIAADNKREHDVLALLEHGATPTRMGMEAVSPLYRIVCSTDMSYDIVRAFVDCGCDVNEENSHGVSILSKALKHKAKTAVDVLVATGADCAHQSVRRRVENQHAPRVLLAESRLLSELYEAFKGARARGGGPRGGRPQDRAPKRRPRP